MTQRIEEGDEVADRQTRRTPGSPPAGGAVYGLGLIGALVWFWRQADGIGGHLTAVLKAMVWPAFLVYAVFKALRQRES
jgi:hypothetical protein